MQDKLKWVVTYWLWMNNKKDGRKLLPPDTGVMLAWIACSTCEEIRLKDPTGAIFIMVRVASWLVCI